MSLCLPGLQGFPIQVSGWTSITDKTSFIVPSDISLQFSPTKLPMIYNDGFFSVNGQNTFFIGGSQYFVKEVRLCNTKQTGLTTIIPIAELHIWGVPTVTSNNQKSVALLNITISKALQTTKQGNNFIDLINNQPVRLDSFIPTGNDINIIRYSTCVETDRDNLNIVIAYWEKGIILSESDSRKVPSPLKPFGIPVLGPFKVLSSFNISVSGKTNRIYTENNRLQQSYTENISATSTEFTNGFRYIKGYTENMLLADINKFSSAEYNTDSYKCVTINPSKDIKDGKILIDPATGKRLSETIKDAEYEKLINKQEAIISPTDIIIYIAIIIGFIIGIMLLYGLFYFIYTFIVTRKSIGDPPIDPNVARAINAIGPIAGNK